jgi:TRAP-type C4-dicarboxylate transport system permease small subunit
MIVSISAFTVVLCFVQIILRYFTFLSFRPLAWGDEILRLSAIWVIFLGISIGVRESAHFSVDLLLNKIKSSKTRQIIDFSIDTLVVLALVLLTYQGSIYSITNTTSSLQNINISMAWFYAAIPVGCIFEIIEYAYKITYGKNYKEMMLRPPKKKIQE